MGTLTQTLEAVTDMEVARQLDQSIELAVEISEQCPKSWAEASVSMQTMRPDLVADAISSIVGHERAVLPWER